MIEINLLPDVKQELIQAQRVRNAVVSMSIILSIAAGAVVALLASYTYIAQPLVKESNKRAITSQHSELLKKPDIAKAVTIQNQLTVLSDQHQQKNVSSRVFDTLQAITPTGDNAISYRSVKVDTVDKKITIEAEAANGYKALEAFKKTILATKFEYKGSGNSDTQSVALTDKVADGDRNLGEDSTGKKVLRFSISFIYNEALLARDSKSGKIVGPTQTNVTDSASAVPRSMFDGGTQ